MPDYRRNRVPGGTFFFTVNLRDRRSDLLVTAIDALRDSVRQVGRALPSTSMRGWSCPTICIASGPCRKAMPISPAGGGRSRPRSRNPCLPTKLTGHGKPR